VSDVSKLDTGPYPKEPTDFVRYTEDYLEHDALVAIEAQRILNSLTAAVGYRSRRVADRWGALDRRCRQAERGAARLFRSDQPKPIGWLRV